MSIKSRSMPAITITPSNTAIAADDGQHVAWLFRQEQPVFLGVVDKDAVTLRIYSLLPIWFLYYRGGPTIGSLSLNPRSDAAHNPDVGIPTQGDELPNWPGHFHFDVDLGHPIAILDLPTIQDEARLSTVKKRLRLAVNFAERNILHYRLQIPNFYWFAKTAPDASVLHPAFSYYPVPPTPDARRIIMGELAPSLISFALHFKAAGDTESLQACAKLLSHAPPDVIPSIIFEHVPELQPVT